MLKICPFALLFVFKVKAESVPLNFGIMILAFCVNSLYIAFLYAFCAILLRSLFVMLFFLCTKHGKGLEGLVSFLLNH